MTRAAHMKGWECVKQAKDLAEALYSISENGNLSRNHVLRNQLRMTVVSVFTNIEEGRRHQTSEECLKFLSSAKIAATKLRTHLILSREGGYLCEGDYLDLEDRTVRIASLVDALISNRQRNISRKRLFRDR